MKLERIKFNTPEEMYEYVVVKNNDIWDGEKRLIYKSGNYAIACTVAALNDVADAVAVHDIMSYTYFLDDEYSGSTRILANCENDPEKITRSEFCLAPTYQFCAKEYKNIWWEVKDDASDTQFRNLTESRKIIDDIPF